MFLKIPRNDFEFEVCSLFDRCMAHVQALLKDAHVTPVTRQCLQLSLYAHTAHNAAGPNGIIPMLRMIVKVPCRPLSLLSTAFAVMSYALPCCSTQLPLTLVALPSLLLYNCLLCC